MTPSEPTRQLGKLLGRHHRQMIVSGANCSACNNYAPSVKEVRDAIEREAQGIPPSEALREAAQHVVDAVANWHLPTTVGGPKLSDALIELRAALAATPSGGIPLIDVELLARALRTNADPPYNAVDVETVGKFDYLMWARQIAAEYTRLSKSSPAEEGAE